MNTLHLTLSKKPFEVMVTGEKAVEYRKPTAWIKSRLLDKQGEAKKYDQVKFVNGYGADKPYFIAKFKGFILNPYPQEIEFSNGLIVNVSPDDIKILIGEIIEKGNL
jgi:hypothetical protein